ncbi:adenosylhomocysteinase [Ktedonosporobacter rubrisoli]|uniref:Adenosylhomocysteinase n=1 Tax=Ktedonosporobacter rubrisoli TaxID=2509675 RepID=A0A4P6JTV5_KTERU|nr:adenosylhomocysteinase [Ktedonosporobacter rubrisoli]QBD78753.1 adenosylhomocysteinase [Ktedonosporobacter rubrisoli]
MSYDIRDITLAERGRQRIAWAARHMPVLNQIKDEFAREQPFQGRRIAASLHITTETAALLSALHAGGAEVALCASNPLSTQDDVCAALAESGIAVYACYSEDLTTYQQHIEQTLALDPHLVMDDGADLIVEVHNRSQGSSVVAGIEETTSGVTRARALAEQKLLRFPVIAVNDTPTKRFFDNRYGTGQNTIDGILRATNIFLAGATFVVAGYGWCGRGIALRARGMGARVIVCEINATRALEAVMEGFQVLSMTEAAPLGDIFITATGMSGVISEQHLRQMKDGAILGNSGHFDIEVDVAALRKLATSTTEIRDHLSEFRLSNGRTLYLLAEGRLVGQVAAEASPAAVMDLSFADQALSTRYLLQPDLQLPPAVYDVPPDIDERVAQLKLQALGIKLDTLNESQLAYQHAWQLGTVAAS